MKKSIKLILYALLTLAGNIAYKKAAAQQCTINLLIAYTDRAAEGLQGNPTAIQKIKEAVQRLNEAYTNSGVTHQVLLVRTVRLNDPETDCFVEDLDAFQVSTYINALRDQYHADIAALVLANKEFCGLPYEDNAVATTATAYCVVNYRCMFSNFALSHQVAHLYGCSHYIEQADPTDDAVYTYGHGFQWDANADDEGSRFFSTIMGVDDADFCGGSSEGSCTIIPYFSNPAVQYQGVALGEPGVHNNAKVLNENAATIAALKPLPDVQNNLSDIVDLHNIAIATARDTLRTGEQGYRIIDSATVRFQAGEKIILDPGFRIEEGARFETVIGTVGGDCTSQASQALAYSNRPSSIINAVADKPTISAAEEVAIYPNPSTGICTITLKGIRANAIEVYSLVGIKIKRMELRESRPTYQLNLSGYAQGVYLVHIIAKDKTIVKKLVLSK